MKILITDQPFTCRRCGTNSYVAADTLSMVCGACVRESDIIAATRPQTVTTGITALPDDPDGLKEALLTSKINIDEGVSAEDALLGREMEQCGVAPERIGLFRADGKLRLLLSKACHDKGAARQMRTRLTVYSIIDAGADDKLAKSIAGKVPPSILDVARDKLRPANVRCEAFAQCLTIAGLDINVD